MYLPKRIFCFLLWGGVCPVFSVVKHPDHGWDGIALFTGEIVSSACGLVMEDKYQEIDLGYMPIRTIQNSFSGSERKFRLRLHDCDFGRGEENYRVSHIRVSFDGLQGETPDKFSVVGQARGINLQILDKDGYPARVGKNMPPLLLNRGEGELDYTLRVVRNGQPLKAGDYYTALRFKVDYE